MSLSWGKDEDDNHNRMIIIYYLRRLIRNSNSVLDIGCGSGGPMKSINKDGQFWTVGLDIFKPYLRECRRQETHNALILCDVRRLPIKEKSFDTVLCMELLEHLQKEEGEKLLQVTEKIARKQILLTTPTRFFATHGVDNNPAQEHVSVWLPKELRQLGYRVRGAGGFLGIGIRLRIHEKVAKKTRSGRALKKFVRFLMILTIPAVYFFPEISGSMLCIKKLPSPDNH